MICEEFGKEWVTAMKEFHLPRWDELPDFEIYMDQLLTIVDQYAALFHHQNAPIITASMVNNYVKAKIMPKPEKKRYQKEHIACVIAITILKEVLTISEIRNGIEIQSDRDGKQGAYDLFCEELESSARQIMEAIEAGKQPTITFGFSKENMAMKLCTFALISKLVARRMVASSMRKKYENK